MMKVWILLLLMISLAVPASALELEAPAVPDSGEALMPRQTESFGAGLAELLKNALFQIRPDLEEAAKVSVSLIAIVMLLAVLTPASPETGQALNLTGTWAVAACLFYSTKAMLPLAVETIQSLTDYGKLLLPVMTAAMAAQGGMTGSAALYAGTSLFSTLLGKLINGLLVPFTYLFLALGIANCATGENLLKRLQDLTKGFLSWCLKVLLTVFTTYMSITGVVSGTTDAAALKAAKMTISTVVPVVGGILSDASESVLVSAGVMKNAAGIYGILAVLAIFLAPFVRIGAHYLVLKGTAAVCSVFDSKSVSGLIDDFSSAMGLLLGMTGSVCLLVLISTVCFLKGVP